MRLYSCTAIADLMKRYRSKGGKCITIEEGCLGYGLMVLKGDGLKTAVIKEVPTSCWSSAHTVRLYNKMPKKYAKMIEEVAV